nr:unnamed protein product [Spirometra erinaceieuropaei]
MKSNPHSSTGLPSVPFLHVCDKDEWFRLTPELYETVSANGTVRRMTVELLKRIRQLNTEVHAVVVSTIHRKKQMQQELDNLYSLQTSGFLLEWIQVNLEALKNIPSPFDYNLGKSAESETSGGHVKNIVSAGLQSAEQFIVTFMKEMERRTQQELPALKCLSSVSNSESILDLVDEERSAHGETHFWNHLLEFAYNQWNELVILSSHKQHSIQMAERFCRLEGEQENCLRWVRAKQELLLTTGNDVADVREVIRMECRMSGWENDLKALTGSVDACLEEMDSLREALSQAVQAGTEGGDGLKVARRAVEEWKCELQKRWQDFMLLLEEHKKKLDMSLALQNVLQEAEEMNLWLRDKQKTIAALEIPITISDIDEQTSIYQNLLKDLEDTEGKISSIQNETYQIVRAREAKIAEAVYEKLESVVRCWTELRSFCQHNLAELRVSRQTQLILRDIDQLNASLSRKESQIARTDYLPNLEYISRQVKLQTEVLASIRAMSTSISQSLTAAAEAKMQDRIRPRAENLRSRFRQVETKAEGVLASLQFHLLEKEKHQQLESMEEWISERQAVVNAQFVITGTSVKQQKAIQKYHLLRNFEAEVDSYSHLAEKIFREHFQHFLHDESNFTENESQLALVRSKFTGIQLKIKACLADLSAQQNVVNALRMLAGETDWLEEKREQIKWDLVGSSLVETERLLLRHRNFAKEVEIRKLRSRPVIAKVLLWIKLAESQNGSTDLPGESNEDMECAALLSNSPHLLVELMDRVSRLLWMQCMVETRLHSRDDTLEHWRLFFSHQMDLIETHNWLAETESAVMTESHASSGVASARAAITKHSFLEYTVSTLQASSIRSLGQKTSQLLADISRRISINKERLSTWKRVSQGLPAESGQFEAAKRRRHLLRRRIHALERSATKLTASQQSLQKQFTDLLNLVLEKKHRLKELLALNRLYDDVADLEAGCDWMTSQTREALLCQTGRDLEECARLQQQFAQLQWRVLGPEPEVTGQLVEASFDRRPELRLDQSAACLELAATGDLPPLPDGPEKLLRAVQTCRHLIALRHSDSPRIALWQGRLAEDWQGLRELLDTRAELLRAAGDHLLLLRRCESVTEDLLDKLNAFPSTIGTDAETLARQQWQLASFQQDILAMNERDSEGEIWQPDEEASGAAEAASVRATSPVSPKVAAAKVSLQIVYASGLAVPANEPIREKRCVDWLRAHAKVNWVLMATEVLLPQYAGEHAQEIKLKRQRMLDAWQRLNETLEQHRRLLREASALDKWLADWTHFLNWTIFTRKILEDDKTLQNCRVGLPEQEVNAGLASTKEISREKLDHLELWREILARKASLTCLLQDGCRLTEWIRSELKNGGEMAKTAHSSLESLIWNSARSIEEDPNFPLYSTSSETVENLPSPNPLTIRKTAVECLLQRSAAATHAMECEMSLLLTEFFFVKCLWKRRMAELSSRMKRAEVLRQIRSLEVWMNNMEKVLQTNDLGSDLYETLNLSDEHQKFCGAVSFQEERIQRLAQMDILQTEDDSKEWLDDIHKEFSELLQEHNLWRRTPSPAAAVEEKAQMDLQPREEQQVLFERKEGILYRRYLGKRSNSRSSARKWRKQFVVLNPDTLSLQFLDLPEICETRR